MHLYQKSSARDLRTFILNRTAGNGDEDAIIAITDRIELIKCLEEMDRGWTFRFMDLPKELRLLVYEKLVGPGIVRRDLDVTRVSRQIKEEAEDELYNPLVLRIKLLLTSSLSFGFEATIDHVDAVLFGNHIFKCIEFWYRWRRTICKFRTVRVDIGNIRARLDNQFKFRHAVGYLYVVLSMLAGAKGKTQTLIIDTPGLGPNDPTHGLSNFANLLRKFDDGVDIRLANMPANIQSRLMPMLSSRAALTPLYDWILLREKVEKFLAAAIKVGGPDFIWSARKRHMEHLEARAIAAQRGDDCVWLDRNVRIAIRQMRRFVVLEDETIGDYCWMKGACRCLYAVPRWASPL